MKYWINRYRPLTDSDVLVDAGCGTGTFLVEMSKQCQVIGIDDFEESLALARPRLTAVGGTLIRSRLDNIPLEDGTASVVTALDVLEHLDDDRAAVAELTRILRPGGLLVVTVPALKMLWSDWDVSLHHRRRYHLAQLQQQLRHSDLELLRCAYFNSMALLPVMLVRAWRKLSPPQPGTARAEDRLPRRWMNAVLYHSMVQPACWNWFYPPAGVSLLGICRKRN